MKLKNLFCGLALLFSLVMVGCGDDDVKNIPTEITTFITQKYGSDVYIAKCEKERNGNYEVDIVDDGLPMEATFTGTYVWLYTSWEIAPVTLPEPVRKYVTATYPGYIIEDADEYDSPQGGYYVLELEQGEREMYLKIQPDGTSPEILPYK